MPPTINMESAEAGTEPDGLPAIDLDAAEADIEEEDVLPGSAPSSPAKDEARRRELAEKRHAQEAALTRKIVADDAALSTIQHSLQVRYDPVAAQTHRQVSLLMQDSQHQWDNTLRASRLLHEKVAQQLQNKAMRRRAQRDVLKRWTVYSKDERRTTYAERMLICCGCSSGHKKKLLSLSDRPMAEAAMLFNCGNWSEAMKAYDHALLMMGRGEQSRQAEAHLVRCECLLRLEDYAAMETEADALLRLAGESWAAYRMRGTARFLLGEIAQAIDDYALALRNKRPSGELASFAGPCTAEAEAAIVADREELVRRTATLDTDNTDVGSLGSEVRDAAAVTVETQ